MAGARGGSALTGWTAPEGAQPASSPPSGDAPPASSYGIAPAPGHGTPPDAGSGYGYGYGWPPPTPAAPRPGIVPLRPLGVGELLDGSFTAIRTAPLASLGIGAIVMLVNQALFLLIDDTVLQPQTRTTTDGSTVTVTSDAVARLGVAYIVITLLMSIELLLLTGVMAAIVGERVVGRRVSLADAAALLRRAAGPLTRVVVIVTLLVTGTVAVAVGPGIAAAAAGAGTGGAWFIVLGLLLAAVPVLYVWTTLSLAPAAVVLERQGVRAALRRSRKLVHGAWWRIFWISLLAWLISVVISTILSLPFRAAGGDLSRILSGRTADKLSFTALLMTALGGFVGGTLARPFQAGVSALLYVDRRMRAEGLDLALAQAASAEPQ